MIDAGLACAWWRFLSLATVLLGHLGTVTLRRIVDLLVHQPRFCRLCRTTFMAEGSLPSHIPRNVSSVLNGHTGSRLIVIEITKADT